MMNKSNRSSLLNLFETSRYACTDSDVQRELEDIQLNTPELFTNYEEVEI